jgi:RHH-type proline utilization regulon transcriptional repressor/proline dehydrogenase/delta 1-pyrroline-5-carboxylate dehydrogenase
VLRPAFASHNLRSLARAIVEARRRDIPDSGYEIQLLYGMAEPVHEAIRSMGLRLRVYAPMGDLVPGMAYLVRRLLENTANESFVHSHYAKGEQLEALLRAPVPYDGADGFSNGSGAVAGVAAAAPSLAPYAPEPEAQWHVREVEDTYQRAVEAEFAQAPRTIPAVIDGRRFPVELESMVVGDWLESVNPADPGSVVAHTYAASPEDADAAVAGARVAAARWRRTPAGDRARVVFAAAAELRRRRPELAALEVREAGKPWAEADADVCEAIDFCEYYGREMLRLSDGGKVQSPAGEANSLTYRPRGVCAVIAPWNFPLAIATGMTVAALVTGNTVILKPAEQTPAIAYELVMALEAAGLPSGVCQFLPGRGEVVGAALVGHPDVDTVAFTGSRAVGLGIVEESGKAGSGRRSIPRTIVELGGKNAIIVCSDADLDEVVPAVITSAFSFSGQKCSALSRLICLDDVYDTVVGRVREAARALVVGPPRERGTQVGPVIDEESRARLSGVVADLAGPTGSGTVVFSHAECPSGGFYVPPTIVGDVDPTASLARDELFGPVLACFRVASLDAALALANDGDYALTAGVFSRSPSDIDFLVGELEAGNIYVNRSITGAVVGRQPFGGRRLSGGGTKAGGPDYLLSFCDPVSVSENTMRQGFAPS